ncbi:MAG: cupin domain-containing protein [Microbacteriaceae bacterium]
MNQDRIVVVDRPTVVSQPDDGAVIPLTVINTPSVRVTEIAFGAGAELAEHSAPAPILVQVIEGAVDFEVGGVTHPLASPGLIHLAAAGERHRVFAARPARIQVTMLLSAP